MKATYEYAHRGTLGPEPVTRTQWRKAARVLSGLPTESRPRRELFAARFPMMGGEQYLFLTKRITDAVAIVLNGHEDAWELPGGLKLKEAPDGQALVPPKPLRDADWDALAHHPWYRRTLSGPLAEGGQELAEGLDGARFDGGPRVGDILVLSNDSAIAFDIFVRVRGERKVRRVLTLAMEE